MSTTLVFGVLLIVAGIAFAILAYALILNRRSEEKTEADTPEAEPSAAAVLEPEPAIARPEPGVVAVAAPLPPAPAPPAALPAAPALPPKTLDVARLLREEVTGSLVVAVGPRVYRTAAELRSSADWTRLEVASRDLQSWFATPAKAKPAEERRPEEPTLRAASMLDQINSILERKLALAPELPQGVRLAPSPEGGVRVLIGLQAYPLDQVPDAKINQLIRESVSEWENQG